MEVCGPWRGNQEVTCQAAWAKFQIRSIQVPVHGVHSIPNAVSRTAFALPVEPEVHIT